MRVPTTPPRWPRISSGLRRQSNHRAPGLPEKGDLTDWLDDEHTVEEFFEIVKTTPAMDSGRAWPEKPSPLDIRCPTSRSLTRIYSPNP